MIFEINGKRKLLDSGMANSSYKGIFCSFARNIMSHKSGFVCIVGKPNSGKSTLLNAMTGEKIAIVTEKAQTTRHRIRCMVNGPDFQIVFSDTPGIIDPAYLLQEKMMDTVKASLADADIVLWLIDAIEDVPDPDLKTRFNLEGKKLFLVFNKMDLCTPQSLKKTVEAWEKHFKNISSFAVSALHKVGTLELVKEIARNLPECPPYYPKDQLTDISEKFFAEEILREKILKYYKEEIPYSVQVETELYKEEENIVRIHLTVYTERESQKGILLGKKGETIKKVGIQARKALEASLGKQVFLKILIKIKEKWRTKESDLKLFGYGISGQET